MKLIFPDREENVVDLDVAMSAMKSAQSSGRFSPRDWFNALEDAVFAVALEHDVLLRKPIRFDFIGSARIQCINRQSPTSPVGYGEAFASLLNKYCTPGQYSHLRWASPVRADSRNCEILEKSAVELVTGYAQSIERRNYLDSLRIGQKKAELSVDVSADANWLSNYLQLVEFKKAHGHCNVANERGPLGAWVSAQRKGAKSPDFLGVRRYLLESVGFCFDNLVEVNWNSKLAELAAFKSINGHCDVPRKSGLLGAWCYRQRELSKKGRLSEDRRQRLEAVGLIPTDLPENDSDTLEFSDNHEIPTDGQ